MASINGRNVVVTVDAAASISEIARLMSLRRIGSVFVRRKEEMIGIVTEPDIIRKGIGQGRDLRTVSAFEIMSSPIVSIDERRPVDMAEVLEPSTLGS